MQRVMSLFTSEIIVQTHGIQPISLTKQDTQNSRNSKEFKFGSTNGYPETRVKLKLVPWCTFPACGTSTWVSSETEGRVRMGFGMWRRKQRG